MNTKNACSADWCPLCRDFEGARRFYVQPFGHREDHVLKRAIRELISQHGIETLDELGTTTEDHNLHWTILKGSNMGWQ